jgi:two-component system alkaline phosphatase synthesis response regulator PhoP
MSVRELEVLVYLIRHQDRIVSVEELRDALWSGDRLSPRSNAIAVTVLRLRTHLEDERGPAIIRTVRRRGYRFYPPEDSSVAGLSPAVVVCAEVPIVGASHSGYR